MVKGKKIYSTLEKLKAQFLLNLGRLKSTIPSGGKGDMDLTIIS
jgi:hypothetical protein